MTPDGPTPPGQPSPAGLDDTAISVFLDQARQAADWHRRSSEAFESKAGAVLGFSGVSLPLLTLVARSIADVDSDLAWWLVGLTIAAAIAFGTAGFAALRVLRPREYRYSSGDQLRTEWAKFYPADRAEGDKPLTRAQALALMADQLIRGSEGQPSPIESLKADAQNRGCWLRWSIRLLFVGFMLVAAVAVAILVEVGGP